MARKHPARSSSLLEKICERLAARPGRIRAGSTEKRRFGFEACESRHMLTATINGVVLHDLTGNGFSADDTPLTNPPSPATITLYNDVNGTGVLAGNDTVVATTTQNAAGAYSFSGLADGLYLVQQTPPTNYAQTAPAAPNEVYSVDIINGNVYFNSKTVDDFNQPNTADTYFISGQNPNPTLLKNSVSGVLGGSRDLFVHVLGVAGPTSAQGSVGGGYLQVGSGPGGVANEATLQYSGSSMDMINGSNQLTNAQALTGTDSDITAGNAATAGLRFDWNFLQANSGVLGITINAFNGAGSEATLSQNVLTSTGPFTTFAPYSSFTTPIGFSFAHVTSLQVIFNTGNDLGADVQVNDIVAAQQNGSINFDDATGISDLAITKIDNVGGSSITPNVGTAVPGSSIIYTVVATNNGPNAALGASIVDPIPTGITSQSFTAVATGGATGYTASASGAIDDTAVDMPAGSTVTYTITAQISPAAAGTLTNTATVTPPVGTTDPTPGNNTAVDVDNLTTAPNLTITKVDNAGGSSVTATAGNVTPGQALTYTVVVSNTGNGAVTGATIADPLPANFTGGTYTATATGGATGFTASGPGNIDDTAVSLPAGSAITYVVTGTVSPSATGTLTNTASVTPSGGNPISAVDNDNLANLSIVKSDNAGGSSVGPVSGNVTPGQSLTYTVVVSNTGTGNVTGATIADPLPANFTGGTYTATATGGATGFTVSGPGNIDDSAVSLPAGSSITYTVVGTVSAAATGTLVNTATVTPASGTPKSATDTDNLANLSIVKSDNAGGSSVGPVTGNVTPGQSLTYTVVVSNTGSGNITGATISDPLPTNLTAASFTATATGGATGFTNPGTGSINDTVNLPAGSTITYTVTGTVNSAATGSLINTATVTPATGTPKSATDTDNLANLTIVKSDSAGGSSIGPVTGNVTPGQSLTYTVVVSNTGTGNVTGATISDPLPADFTGGTYTATATGGATGFTASGPGNINDTAVSLPAGSSITYVVTGTVSSTATGTLLNVATIAPAAGTPKTAADRDNLANLSIVKSDNAGGSSVGPVAGNVTPGQSLTYTVVVSNTGTGNVTGATIADPLPANFTGGTYTATATGGATGFTVSGPGNINDTSVSLPAGSSITYVVTGTVSAAATGTLINTATITPANGTPQTATDTDNLANLSIVKSDNAGGSSVGPVTGNVTPGQSLTYTVVVSNTGTGNITGAKISDPLPANLTGATFTATATGGATGFTNPGTGNINDTVSLPAGSSITYTVTGTVNSTATGSLINTATVTPATGTPKAATDTDNLAKLSIIKSDNAGGSSVGGVVGNVTPGQTLTYTVVVSNTGTGNVTGAVISDPLPANLTGVTYTATPTGGASGFTSPGSGNIADTVSLPAGSSITYTVTGTVSAAATGTLVNTATITPTTGTPQTATDTDNLANLSIVKSDNAGGSSIGPVTGNVTPGQSLTYTVVVSNTGLGNITGAKISDPLPTNLTGGTFTATATGGATGFTNPGTGNINDTVNLPAGSSITYTVTGTVNSTATGSLINTATVTPAAGTPKTATDTDNLANLSIVKSDNAGGSSVGGVLGNVTPGQTLTYTVVVSNTGTGNIAGAVISDPLPTNLTGGTFTATATGGATGFTNPGTGNINDTVNLPAGSSITYTVTGTVSSAATGTLTNSATVTPATGTPKTATDVDNLANLSIVKYDNAGGSSSAPSTGNVTPGQSLTYTVVVSNTGLGNVVGAKIADLFPVNFTGATFTATPTGGASGFTSPGAGNVADTVNLPAGSSITYVIIGTVSSTASGTLSNTATVTPAAGTPKSATDVDNITATADLSITKSDNKGGTSVAPATIGTVLPGTSFVYTITVTNSGPSPVTGAKVVDNFPAGITSDTFTATSTLGASGFTMSGGGNINDTVTMPVGSTIVYTVTANVSSAFAGTLSNTATVMPPVGVTDPTPANNTATDVDNVPGTADLSITKSDNKGATSVAPATMGTVIPGTTIIYTVIVTNSGPSNVSGATITDPFSTGITSDTFTATTTGGASGFTTSGNGPIDDTAVNMPAGSAITYTVTAQVSPSATGTLPNTATVMPPSSVTDPNPGNNTASIVDNLTPTADLKITKVDSVGGSSITGTTGSLVTGQTYTYTIMATNLGPSAVTGATIADTFPAAVASDTWTATATGGATGFSATGAGNIDDLAVNLPVGSIITYVVTATLNSTTTGPISNTATILAPSGVTDPTPANNTAVDNDNIAGGASSLSGYVYVDSNNNGVKDPGELPIAAVVVTLTGTTTVGNTPVNESTTTSSLGYYDFANLPAGTYTITETQPINFTPSLNTVGSQGSSQGAAGTTLPAGSPTNVIGTIALGAGVNGVSNNFGDSGLAPQYISKRSFLDPANTTYLANIQSLSGYVYTEATAGSANYNPASPAAGEAALPGATVTLTGTSTLGAAVNLTTTSGPQGWYSFTGVPTGTFSLTVTGGVPVNDTVDTAFVGSQTTGTAGAGTITGIVVTPQVDGVNNNFPITKPVVVPVHNAALSASAVDAALAAPTSSTSSHAVTASSTSSSAAATAAAMASWKKSLFV